MKLWQTILIPALISISFIGCAPNKALQPVDLRSMVNSDPEVSVKVINDSGKGQQGIYQKQQADEVKNLPDLNRVPYVPIVLPPRVLKGWLYTHEAPSGDLVMGTSVFICLDLPCKWFTYKDNNKAYSPSANQSIPKLPYIEKDVVQQDVETQIKQAVEKTNSSQKSK